MVDALCVYLPPQDQDCIKEALNADKLTVKYDEYRWSFHYPIDINNK